jgi:4-hydroxy-tetrahydrodipicolinate synthase
MFFGSMVALVTPFTKEGEIDKDAFSKLVEWQIQEGTDCITVCGTTGEAATISLEELQFLIQRAVEIAKGRVSIVAGTASNDTHKAVQRTQAAKNAGADAALVITPYYNRPSLEGLLVHYKEIAKAGLPIIFNHNPARTGLKLSPAMIAKLAEIPEVIALKDSYGDMDPSMELLSISPKPILAGDDVPTLALLACGAIGACSVIGNIVPRAWKKMIASVALGDVKGAREIFMGYLPLLRAMFLESNPVGVKCAMDLLGKCGPTLRLPLVAAEATTRQKIQEELLKLNLLKERAELPL